MTVSEQRLPSLLVPIPGTGTGDPDLITIITAVWVTIPDPSGTTPVTCCRPSLPAPPPVRPRRRGPGRRRSSSSCRPRRTRPLPSVPKSRWRLPSWKSLRLTRKRPGSRSSFSLRVQALPAQVTTQWMAIHSNQLNKCVQIATNVML